ncbi:DEAD/DEAH box helicase [Cylindrospermopsis raciborskii]|uniref:DEAD/DEAH box helicase n=1 Tax=Cylindrospermopsis raciborskii TaxID=77022 RepID=UPI001F340CCD|nr:DEAD/DEAH box helicase [Cylindrospermopsis raciborskii]UJS05360.1 SNF2-related protein [Cylindrospermopsis raciborskii KLL07]
MELAPGARILCRDAEWLVKDVSLSSDGDKIIQVVGVSEFIRGTRSLFLEELESKKGPFEVLKAEKTGLVTDTSPEYRNSRLFIEANLKQIAPPDSKIYVGDRAAMDTLKYQLSPTSMALKMLRQRMLIADGVGLGKTLECGILVAELIARHRGRRILVVTSKSMMAQFQKEFWFRFTIPLVRLDSTEVQRIKSIIPTNHNPFYYYDRTIISIDTLKQDREYRNYLEKANWDIIIIDEAHNVAKRGRGKDDSLRSKLALRLSSRSDTLILLSATPHDGKPESFASLMNMLDPTAIADESDYTKDDIRNLYIRRFKKDVLADLRDNVPERHSQSIDTPASESEERVFDLLDNLNLSGDKQLRGGQLFKTTLLKSILSSHKACLATVNNRLKKLKEGNKKNPVGGENHRADIEALQELQQSLGEVGKEDFSKYQRLLKLIKQDLSWNGEDSGDRLVIFTGRLETLDFLFTELQKDLKLKSGSILKLKGDMSDTQQLEVVEQFSKEKDPVRILLATEVASEGINLHYLSHRLIHFDIPWSFMTLQQRNGRIDRYGQSKKPEIRYLLTRSRRNRMDEVHRIIKVLLAKEEQATKNIGDPAILIGVFDAQEEENYISDVIEQGKTAEEFNSMLENNNKKEEGGLFDWFENDQEDDYSSSPQPEELCETGSLLSLFDSTFDFVSTALSSDIVNVTNLNINQQVRFIELQLPDELRSRYKRLPREIIPEPKDLLYLTDSPQVIKKEIADARQQEKQWSMKQYLWELHPLVEWLTDRCLFHIPRHQAPVIQLPSDKKTLTFICFGSFSNRQGSPIISRQFSVIVDHNNPYRIEDFAETIKKVGLNKPIPNPGNIDISEVSSFLKEVVKKGQEYLEKERKTVQQELNERIAKEKGRLKDLRQYHLQKWNHFYLDSGLNQKMTQEKVEKKQQEIDKMFQEHEQWVERYMSTSSAKALNSPTPYIKLIAVLRG